MELSFDAETHCVKQRATKNLSPSKRPSAPKSEE